MPAEGRLAPQAKVGVNARRGLSEEDERDIAKPLTTRRGLAYTYLIIMPHSLPQLCFVSAIKD